MRDAQEATQMQDLGGLFRSHRAELVRVAFALTGSRDSAEDVVQEVAVRLSGNAGLGNAAEPLAYLRRAVVNEAFSFRRRLARQSVRARKLELEALRRTARMTLRSASVRSSNCSTS